MLVECIFSPPQDRSQVTVAAFLNMFIAWEGFLEGCFGKFMTGAPTLSGSLPDRYASPAHEQAALAMLIGVQRYFDFSNHEYVKKIARIYFASGYPFEPHLSAITSDLSDIKTMRNASAHITSTTQSALEGLAQRIFSTPRTGVTLYQMLTSIDPRNGGTGTVFSTCVVKLRVAAGLIANG
jgi:hypothetical protein